MIGAGHQGSIIARTLTEIPGVDQVTIMDSNDARLRQFSHTGKISTLRFDARDDGLPEVMKEFDLVSGALPSNLGFRSISAAIEAGVNMVDMSFMPEDPLALHASAEARNVTVVPDCGVAPGLSNILVGRSLAQLDRADEIHILVGGLPQSPQPPLGYSSTWSVRDLIEEYVRPARIVTDGLAKSVEALSGLGSVDIPGLGRLEAFYTDGLRTLIETVTGVKEMDEKTLRYPGHVEKIRVLRDCGFFSREPVVSDGCHVSPRDVSAEVLSRVLYIEGARDMTILQVHVLGEKAGRAKTLRWSLLDYYDEAAGVSSMSRTTASTNVAVCTLLLSGLLWDKGVIPPERLGMKEEYFLAIMSELKKKGIALQERVE